MKSQNGDMGWLNKKLARKNIKLARRVDAGRSLSALVQLRDLTLNFGFSLASGELLHLDGGWYVTHTALLRLASRKRCAGISVEQVDQSPIHWQVAGFSRLLCSKAPLRWDSSAMEMPILQTFLPWCEAPKCVWPKPAP